MEEGDSEAEHQRRLAVVHAVRKRKRKSRPEDEWVPDSGPDDEQDDLKNDLPNPKAKRKGRPPGKREVFEDDDKEPEEDFEAEKWKAVLASKVNANNPRESRAVLPFLCEQQGCGARFGRPERLKLHSFLHQANFVCEGCDKRFGSQKGLQAHQYAEHVDKTDSVCGMCCSRFGSREALQTHNQDRHAEGITCSSCEQVCDSFRTWSKHFDDVHVSKTCQCTWCAKLFEHREELDCHTRYHVMEDPWICCGHQYRSEHGFRNHHAGAHSDVRRYVCDADGCNFATSNRATILRHKRVHLGLTYVCAICSQNYSSFGAYTNHMSTHVGGKRRKRPG